MLYVLNAIELENVVKAVMVLPDNFCMQRALIYMMSVNVKKFSDHDITPLCHVLAVIERFCADFIERVVYMCFKQEPPCHWRQRDRGSWRVLKKARVKRSCVSSISTESDARSGWLNSGSRDTCRPHSTCDSDRGCTGHWQRELDKAVNPSFDLDSRLRSDLNHVQKSFCDDWISNLEREDSVFRLVLCFQLWKHFDLGDTKAAEIAEMMFGRSDKSVCEWRKQFF